MCNGRESSVVQKCQNVAAFVLTTLLADVQCRHSECKYGGPPPSAAAIERIQNAAHFADWVFEGASAVFAARVFRIGGNAPVEVRYLPSLETIWPARIRGQCMATADSRTYRIFL
jgi:hypothetical protein